AATATAAAAIVAAAAAAAAIVAAAAAAVVVAATGRCLHTKPTRIRATAGWIDRGTRGEAEETGHDQDVKTVHGRPRGMFTAHRRDAARSRTSRAPSVISPVPSLACALAFGAPVTPAAGRARSGRRQSARARARP